MTRPGLILLRASYPRPHFSSVPGLKFSTTTSPPKSARSWPQKGPASRLPISTTQTPSRGRVPLSPSAIQILFEGSYDEVAALVDVLAHSYLRPAGVAFLQGFQDLAVIEVGDHPLVRRVPEEGLEHERYLDGAVDQALQTPVAAGLGDGS